jgi:hypothetical protein
MDHVDARIILNNLPETWMGLPMRMARKQEREACTYDGLSTALPTARDVNVTPCGFGGYGL